MGSHGFTYADREMYAERLKAKKRGYVRKYYNSHKDKCIAYAKEYRQRPEVKERRRVNMAQWRKENHDKSLEISRKCRKKHATRLNAVRREKWRNDPEYKRKKIESEKRYKATGRRKELRVINAVELRKRSAAWKKKNPELVKKYVKWYRKTKLIHFERLKRKTLADQYIIGVIKKSMNYKLKTKDIPQELIEMYRIRIKTIRSLKNQTR